MTLWPALSSFAHAETANSSLDAGGADIRAEQAPAGGMHIPGPSLAGWKSQRGAASDSARPTPGSDGLLEVTAFEVEIYPEPHRRYYAIGNARQGNLLPASAASGRDCDDGSWYRVSAGGYVCTGDGARLVAPGDAQIGRATSGSAPWLWAPSDETPHPLLYARVITKRAPRLSALPTDEHGEPIPLPAEPKSSQVERFMVGDYFLALAGEREHAGQRFYQTVQGRFVRADDIELKPAQPMHGEALTDDVKLPLAFTLDDAPLYCHRASGLERCGTIAKHARFAAAELVTHEGKSYMPGPEGTLVAADALRVARKAERPSGVSSRAKWVHVDLSQQVLVAYEGDKPVYTTLVSSGRDGYHTPRGLFRVERKYFTKTMRGDDDVSGSYEVQEIPWVMYYDGNYALHGAYWHNLFGRTKSHGCTNIPPVDARWLYRWADLELPAGWHSMYHRKGTYVYISGQTPADGK